MTYAMTDLSTDPEASVERPLIPEDQWPELSIDALTEQKEILFNRWAFLVAHKYPYAVEVKKGLDKLEAYIYTR